MKKNNCGYEKNNCSANDCYFKGNIEECMAHKRNDETRKQHFFSTADFWREQAEGGEDKLLLNKWGWKRVTEIKNLKGNCAFCHYFSCDPFGIRPPCPLNGYNMINKYCAEGNYIKWENSSNDPSVRLAGARGVWDRIKPWMEKNYPEYFEAKNE